MAMQTGVESPGLDVTMAQRQVALVEAQTQAQFQSIRAAGGSTDATFSYGGRSLRPTSAADGDRYYANDVGTLGGWLYYWAGTGWEIVVGFASGTDATRAAYTPDATDNGAWFFATDTGILWEVSGGAWVNRFTTIAVTTAYKVGTNQIIGARKTGWTLPTSAMTRTNADYSTLTLAQLAEVVAALVNDIHADGGTQQKLLST